MSKVLLVAALLVATTQCVLSLGDAQWAEFKAKYGKSYAHDEEELRRYNTFRLNMVKADMQRKINPEATFGMTPYADLTAAEFKRYHNGQKELAARSKQRREVYTPTEAEAKKRASLPANGGGKSIDWRQRGAVTPVHNMGQCGSPYAFSVNGNVEGITVAQNVGKLVALSAQFFTSCDTIDDGCNGGLMSNAIQWLINDAHTGGRIPTAESYPYVSGSGDVPACANRSQWRFGPAVVTGNHDITHNEDDMATYVATRGPISVAVDATSWQMYSGGVLTTCVYQQLDHAVTAVGFDDSSKTPYWILKNEWGADWGEEGYIRIKKGDDQCGVGKMPSSALIK